MKIRYSVRSLALVGLIAAVYATVSLLSYPISFGPFQCRVSEALTVMPIILPEAVPGLALGCAIANLIGIGASPIGAWDILFGTLATLLAAICTRCLRRVTVKGVPLPATLPPILFNAAVVGFEVAYFCSPGFSLSEFLVCAAWIALGEAVAVWVVGLPLYYALRKPLSKW